MAALAALLLAFREDSVDAGLRQKKTLPLVVGLAVRLANLRRDHLVVAQLQNGYILLAELMLQLLVLALKLGNLGA